MLKLWKKLFSKPEDGDGEDESSIHDFDTQNPENIHFTLFIDSVIVGYLRLENNVWIFNYSDDFKKQDKYHRLVGFPLLDKVYKSSELWPFFKIRIPGLKQPMIQEIIEKEGINSNSELALLKRFGLNSISNPYILRPTKT